MGQNAGRPHRREATSLSAPKQRPGHWPPVAASRCWVGSTGLGPDRSNEATSCQLDPAGRLNAAGNANSTAANGFAPLPHWKRGWGSMIRLDASQIGTSGARLRIPGAWPTVPGACPAVSDACPEPRSSDSTFRTADRGFQSIDRTFRVPVRKVRARARSPDLSVRRPLLT